MSASKGELLEILRAAFEPMEEGMVMGPIDSALLWMSDRQAPREYSGQWRYNDYEALREWSLRARKVLEAFGGN